jgi:predicted lipoprotein with Yx(FWY)xxD motif
MTDICDGNAQTAADTAPRPRRRWGLPLVVLVTAVASVLITGCGSSGSSSPTTTTAATPTTAAPTTTQPPAATTTTGPAPVSEVRTGTVKGLGTVLVDGQGFTLYLFVPDKQSGTSTCYGPCATAWPPLLLPAGKTVPEAGPGVTVSLLGTTHRSDGTTEITYNKWPLYLWAGDSEPGQATGQGINNNGGLWYVLSPQGQEITTAP